VFYVNGNASSGCVAMDHMNNNTPLLMPGFNIPVRLDDLLQWIASIDDRPQCTHLNQALEGGQRLRG
jgi:hypothetical protein